MAPSKVRPSRKAASFTESVIREMTRLAIDHGAINLSQGFPDFSAPPEVKEAARQAIADDINQYPITWGAERFREAIAAMYRALYGMTWVDPLRHITVTCGSTEGMIAAMLGVLDPGDEVILFEPYYENYRPDSIISGAVPRLVTLHEPDWAFDPDELAAAFGPKTRGIVLNTPNNPTGKVFTRKELETIAALCVEHDVVAFTDEIYEHITYDGHLHIPPGSIPGMEDRTVTISALSKTYAVTGWRVGWVVAPD
ncbi:MAG: aminotransferase, partial [Actinomycetota bacterium]|nr:aminotransferase [Actinomycetota bacterium]